MKKTAIIVIVMLIAMFFVTCDEFFPNEEKVEYTDVVYSEDGSRVTIYLDGVGVPLTAAQRAMSTRLSKMAYDYLDVVFVNASIIARAQWELGQSAGISGVDRGTTATPISYGSGKALLAAGLKSNKTLLGIGEIKEVDGATTTDVGPSTKSVTFYVEAVKTILDVATRDAEANFPSTLPAGVSSPGSFARGTTLAVWPKSEHKKLGNSYIPAYPLPEANASPNVVSDAAYVFFGAADKYKAQLKYAAAASPFILVEPRFPRYMDGGRYKQITATIDMKTTVVATQPANATDTFDPKIPLTFTSLGSGIFSFYIEIPVYVLNTSQGTNAGKLDPIKWKIRTGLGSELYSLDDGFSGGGCVLMTIGELDLDDWLEIQWDWLQ